MFREVGRLGACESESEFHPTSSAKPSFDSYIARAGTNNTMAPASANDVKALEDVITSTLALLVQFVASLADTNASAAKPIPNPPNPLDILSDAATLLKAHVTKLSLLAINKPFTATAATKVIRELTGTCLPALISAVQICEQEKTTWAAFMGREAQNRVRRVFKELESLLQEVRNIAQGAGAGFRGNRDSLSSTGVVWESCDALTELKKLGVAGLAVQKAEQWRDTIKDAITELQEWNEGEDLDTEGQRDALLDSDDEGVEGDADSFDDVFNAANSLPADRPELKQLVEEAMEKLKKVGILYQALIKRRLKTHKNEVKGGKEVKQSSAEYLDDIITNMRVMPHMVDELASMFYELDEEQARSVLQRCVAKACNTAKLAELTYLGAEDEFTAWSKKWKEALG